MKQLPAAWDTIVIGAGPAGLTAALYLARFRRRVLVLHDGKARALHIPLSHNVPGFPDGIAGSELIARMTSHAEAYGAIIKSAEVTGAAHDGALFTLTAAAGQTWRSRTLILAAGLHLNQIALDPVTHQAAIDAGVLRYCPICDGFEHIDQRIGVIGCDSHGAAEALFLRRYSRDVTLIPRDYADLDAATHQALLRAGITVVDSPVRGYAMEPGGIAVDLERGPTLHFAVIYPALGTRPRSALAEQLGLHPKRSGTLPADAPFKTEVPGLWSAGDLVDGLDQISTAFGQGAVAATKAHNWLGDRDGEAL